MNNMSQEPVDLDRLERGVQLVCGRVGEGRYHVAGGASDHWVDLGATGAGPKCDCADYLWRDHVCKHILAAQLREGHSDVIAAIGPMVLRLKQALEPAA